MSGQDDWDADWAGLARSEPADGPAPAAARPAPPAGGPRPPSQQPPPGLSSAALLHPRKAAPGSGWRRLVHRVSRGAVNPGPSVAERAEQTLTARIRVPVARTQHVAVISLKGGVGKTTTTLCLGATLAELRPDQIVAIDANPDRGTLAGRVPLRSDRTVRDLLRALPEVTSYADVRAHTAQHPSRLEVLASDQDPAASQAFGEQDYRTVTALLETYYQVILTDSGTGLLHSAMSGVLAQADQIVLVTGASVDGGRSADATLDWLAAHGRQDLVSGAVAAVTSVLPGRTILDDGALAAHFAARCRAVVAVPHDPHLEEGGAVDIARLRPSTLAAFRELAALVADGFTDRPSRSNQQQPVQDQASSSAGSDSIAPTSARTSEPS